MRNDDSTATATNAGDAGAQAAGNAPAATGAEEASTSDLFKEMAARADEELVAERGDPAQPGASKPADDPGEEVDDGAGEDAADPRLGEADDDDDGGDKDKGAAPAGDAPAADGDKAARKEPTDEEALAALPEEHREPMRKLLAARDSRFADLDHRVRSQLGRLVSITRRAATSSAHGPADSPEARAAQAAADQFAKEYPKLVKGLDAYLKAQGLNTEGMNQLLAFVATSREVAVAEEVAETMDGAHPYWDRIVNAETNPDFKGWLAQQPKKIQALAASDDPIDSTLLLDRYKAHRPAQYAAAQSAASPATTGKKADDPPPPAPPQGSPEADRVAARRQHQAQGARVPSGAQPRGAPDTNADQGDKSSLFRSMAAKADKELAGRF